MTSQNAKAMLVYIGTYTRGESEGIYVHRLDMATGELVSTGQAAETANPSFLALHPKAGFLYAVGELRQVEGRPGSAVSAFAIDPETGGLTLLNQQLSGGAGPCHLTVDATGRYVLVANYGSGGVAALPIRDDGRLAPASDTVQHEGSSSHPKRQQGPHAHSINLAPDNRFAFVPDLGIDKVMIYKLDLGEGKLPPNDAPWAAVKPGAGPRHFAFHPTVRWAYVINELDCTITAFDYDASKGTLTQTQTVPTLPEGFEGTNTCADIHVHPSGKFLYGSNRGHDSIVIFAIDATSGKLTYIGHESTQGQSPRNFGIDPTGTFLLAANQRSDTIVTFRIDADTGTLTPTGHVANVPTPVCVKFMQ
ncbi:MAG: lactonase family protein [Armatimonadota bacterium]